MNRRLLLLAVVLAAMLIGWGIGSRMYRTAATGDGARDFYATLGLTGQQADSLRREDSSFRVEMDALCLEICQERAQLLSQMKDGRVSREAALERVDQIGRMQVLLERKIITHLMGLHRILTPPQTRAYIDGIYQQQCQIIHRRDDGRHDRLNP